MPISEVTPKRPSAAEIGEIRWFNSQTPSVHTTKLLAEIDALQAELTVLRGAGATVGERLGKPVVVGARFFGDRRER